MYHLRPAADLVIVHSHSAYIQSSLCIYNPIGHEYLYPDALCREPLSADFKSWLRRPMGSAYERIICLSHRNRQNEGMAET